MALIDTERLSQTLADNAGITIEEASRFLESFASVIADHVRSGEEVEVQGMGRFVIIDTKQTAMRRVALMLSDTMKDEVNAPFSFFEPYVIARGKAQIDDHVCETEKNEPTEDENETDDVDSENTENVDLEEAQEKTVEPESERENKNQTPRHIFFIILFLVLACAVCYIFIQGKTPPQTEPEPMPADTVVTDSIEAEADTVAPQALDLMLDSLGNPVFVHVRDGEWLTVISEQYFGSKAFWPYIYWVNRDVLSSPSTVLSGELIRLPSVEYYNIDAKDPVSVQKACDFGVKLIKE